MDTPSTNRAHLPKYVLEAAMDVWGQAGKQHFIPITGCSMLPLIRDGDNVLVVHGCARVRRGDVITFHQGDMLVAHRVFRVYGSDGKSTLVTKGDNSPKFDSPFSADKIVGRVLAVERDGRYMSLDTAALRILGWVIVVTTLIRRRMDVWCRDLEQRLLGPQRNRLTAFVRRSALAFFSLALKVVQAVVCRWRTASRACNRIKPPALLV